MTCKKQRNARYWTAEDENLMRQHYADIPTGILSKQLQRSCQALRNKAYDLGVQKNIYDRNNGNTRFAHGNTPWNKGKKYTLKKKRRPQKNIPPNHNAHNSLPIGSVRRDGDRYARIKVSNVYKATKVTNWPLLHVHMWEQQNGPVADGHIISFKNGNRYDIRLENLEMITRAENLVRHSIQTYPPEIAAIQHQRSVLTRIINQKFKQQQEQADEDKTTEQR